MSDEMREDEQHTDNHQSGPSRKRFRSVDNNSMNSPTPASLQEESACCGILEYVTVKNFMCHDHLTFPFSPNVNFIQGRNGSGKSALLTAIIAGLGGSSRLTNRGNSLKELVKYGKQIATLEIAIKNSGKDAYRHDQYGDTIIVERKILATGGGGYKLLSKNRRVVSTKKDELTRLLDHYNVQVDNPMTVLNQDMSRAFLNSTDPHVLYKFFLKATQLQQMIDDYSQLDKALRSSSEIIQNRKESLPFLEEEVEDRRVQYEFCLTLNDKRKKLSELRREYAWSMIIQKEKTEADAKKKVEQLEKIKEKAKDQMETLKQKLKEGEELYKGYKEKFNEVTKETKVMSKEVQVANDVVIMAKREMKDKQGHLNTAQRKIKEIKKDIHFLKDAVDKANTNAQSQWSLRRAKWQEDMEQLKQEQDRARQDAHTEEAHHLNLINTLNVRKDEFIQANLENKALKRKIGALEQDLKGLKGQQGNQLTVFGQWVPQLLREIDVAHKKRAFSKKPVGPLGAFVKMRDSSWGHVAEAVLSSRISAFCVDNRSDEQVLRKIMNGINFNQQQQPFVIVARFREKVHDVSKFEVKSNKYPSLWSVLMISNTVVANTIIDLLQVESTMLIPTAEEAGRILKDKATVPVNCNVAYTLNMDIYYPDPNYRLYSGRGKQPVRFLQVSMEQKLRDTECELENVRTELKMVVQNVAEAGREVRKLEEEVRISNKKTQGHKRIQDQLRLQLAEMQNQEEPPPPDMSQLEEDLKQHQDRLTEEQENLSTFQEQCLTASKKFGEASSQCEKMRKLEKNSFQEAESINEQVIQCTYQKNDILTGINTSKQKLQDYGRQGNELENLLQDASENLKKGLEAAEKFQPRINTTRSVAQVKRQYDSLEARLNKERAQSGDPVTITKCYKEIRQRYLLVSVEIEGHSGLIKEIHASLEARKHRYKKFRRMLSVMIKSNFKCNMSTRNMKGYLQFDFEEDTLNLNVSLLDNGSPTLSGGITRSGKPSKKQEPTPKLALMSGGERSFSTVSFIMALWQVIESPFRILDEFDVFMDVVARRRAMEMMIKSAKPKTQYIYLTPLELNKTTYPTVDITVFRMQDPERDENKSDKRNS